MELAEVTWVYRALENDRIGSLGVNDKLGQSTLSLHVSSKGRWSYNRGTTNSELPRLNLVI